MRGPGPQEPLRPEQESFRREQDQIRLKQEAFRREQDQPRLKQDGLRREQDQCRLQQESIRREQDQRRLVQEALGRGVSFLYGRWFVTWLTLEGAPRTEREVRVLLVVEKDQEGRLVFTEV